MKADGNQNNHDSLFIRTVRSNTFYILGGKIITPFVTFLTTIYIIRKISVTDYGIYNVLLAIMAYVGLVSSAGLLNIFQRFIPEFHQNREYGHVRKLTWQGTLFRLVASGILIGLVFLFSGAESRLFNISDYITYIQIFALGILFFLESQLVGLALISTFLHKYFVFAQISYTGVRALLLLALLESGMALTGLLWAETAGFAFLLGAQAFYFYKYYWRVHPEKQQGRFPYRRLLRYGGFSYFNEVGEQILDVSTDFFVISAYLGARQVGLYAFANETIRLLSRWMPHRLLMDVITPVFFSRFAESGDPGDLEKMFRLLVKLIAFMFFPVVAGLFILGGPMIRFLFDAKYLDALPVLWLVAVFSAINAFAYPIGLMVQAVEKVEIHLMSKLFSIYNLAGDILVVRPYGITGIAVVTGSAVLFKNIFTFFMIRRHLQFRFPVRSLITISVNSVLTALVFWLLKDMVSGLAGLIIVTMLGGSFYLIASYLNRGFSPEEHTMINRILKKKVFHF